MPGRIALWGLLNISCTQWCNNTLYLFTWFDGPRHFNRFLGVNNSKQRAFIAIKTFAFRYSKPSLHPCQTRLMIVPAIDLAQDCSRSLIFSPAATKLAVVPGRTSLIFSYPLAKWRQPINSKQNGAVCGKQQIAWWGIPHAENLHVPVA